MVLVRNGCFRQEAGVSADTKTLKGRKTLQRFLRRIDYQYMPAVGSIVE